MRTELLRIKNDIEALSEFNSTPGQGLTRFSFTTEDRLAREYLKAQLHALDLAVYEDAAGSIFGRQKGFAEGAPSIMIGSHYDSVKNGGNFDGPAGVVMGLEIMRVLKEQDIQTAYPVEFVAMIEEEGGRFGSGVFASRAMAGLVDVEQLHRNCDEDGISMAQAMREFGFDPDLISQARRSPESIRAFIELHIEQGPVLESSSTDIGIVDFIVGINEFKVTVSGRPDHAGTTPMDMRADALDAAAQVISKIKGFAIKAGDGTVATVGVLKVSPGAANIVPGAVSFTVDIRSKSANHIQSVRGQILEALQAATQDSGLDFETIDMLDVAPVEMDKSIMTQFQTSADALDKSYTIMRSGAGHDAMIMGAVTDVGLIFVPSKNGRSHCPEEWTDYEDLQAGIEVILDTIISIKEK